MAVQKSTIKAFVSGTHNLIDDELIPQDAASTSIGWLTRDGKIELMYGRQAQGAEGSAGAVLSEHTGYKVGGQAVRFRKVSTGSAGKVQYLNGSTWTDVITGLDTNPATFSNYSSLAGNFVYVTSPTDGLFKIVTANPASYSDVYLSTKNFKGYSFIDKGRMILWGRTQDATGLYGSFIDAQDSGVYTAVSNENVGTGNGVLVTFTDTLVFKAGGARRTCFGITVTDGTETFTDNYDGTLTGSAGGTGTINYTTGAISVTFNAVVTDAQAITCNYQWEDSSNEGVTDFSKSGTRLAGEGFVVRQDIGGDAIQVVVPHDGSYFSFKKSSVYQFTLDAADTDPLNELIRSDIGVDSLRSAVPTSTGIVFMNTGNPTRPMINILQRNPVGDNFLTTPLFAQFKFENYVFGDVVIEPWDKYVIVSCREDSLKNNRLLLCDMTTKTVDVAPYGGSAFTKNGGFLYMGDPNAQTSYEMFTGFDDMGLAVTNSWTSAGERYGEDALKKVKKLRFRGQISPDQDISVYISTDNGDYQLIGTILGSGDYVDYNSTTAIGTSFIGVEPIGGDDQITIYNFYMEVKIRIPKFRKRKLQFIANGIGYCAIQEIQDFDVWVYEDRLPKQYRQKQNVSLDGETTDMDNPDV
jgi:hypothetical protein